jgi:hypothetical protein
LNLSAFSARHEFNFANGALADFPYAALTVGLEFRYDRRLINMPWHRN